MAVNSTREVNEEILDEMERTKWRRVGMNLKKDWRLYTLLFPLLLFMFLFKYLPIKGVLQAFKVFNSSEDILANDWYGLSYVKTLFRDEQFWTAFRNTFVNSMYGLVFGFPIPIILAILFSEIKSYGYRSVLQVCSYLPKFLSTVVTTTIIQMWCQHYTVGEGETATYAGGLLTKAFVAFGWIEEVNETTKLPVRILETSKFFRPIYQVSGVWEGAGYSSIVYFAAVLAISPTNYEAAKIDGASKLQQIRYVTIPSMAPTLTIMLIMRIGQILNVGYEKVLLLYNIQIYETADVISTYIIRMKDNNGDTGKSIGTAADLMNSLIAMCLVLGANAISRRVGDTALF